jgi:hypothetical protein
VRIWLQKSEIVLSLAIVGSVPLSWAVGEENAAGSMHFPPAGLSSPGVDGEKTGADFFI